MGYTDGYGWVDEPNPKFVGALSELEWLVEVIEETTGQDKNGSIDKP